ncbi:hypothetical protein ACNKHL_21280 [Shigella flexneri]
MGRSNVRWSVLLLFSSAMFMPMAFYERRNREIYRQSLHHAKYPSHAAFSVLLAISLTPACAPPF